jgi:hypothetical protein
MPDETQQPGGEHVRRTVGSYVGVAQQTRIERVVKRCRAIGEIGRGRAQEQR